MRESLTVEQFVVLGLRCHELKRYVQFSHPKHLIVLFLLHSNMGRLRGHKTTHGNHGTFEKPHVGYARAVLPPVDKNDNNSHVNLENLEEYFLQMIQKTLWNLNGMMALKNDD